MIQNSEFVEKTTYKDGREKTIYSISIDKYFDFMQQINSCDTKDCSLINANITVDKLEYINSILIDLSNYYDYQYLINIKYFNINTN